MKCTLYPHDNLMIHNLQVVPNAKKGKCNYSIKADVKFVVRWVYYMYYDFRQTFRVQILRFLEWLLYKDYNITIKKTYSVKHLQIHYKVFYRRVADKKYSEMFAKCLFIDYVHINLISSHTFWNFICVSSLCEDEYIV